MKEIFCSAKERYPLELPRVQSQDVPSPSPVTLLKRGAGVTTRPHESAPCGPPHGLEFPWRFRTSPTSSSPCEANQQAVFKPTAAALVVLLKLQF